VPRLLRTLTGRPALFVLLILSACAHAPGYPVPGSNRTAPRSAGDQLLAALLMACQNGQRTSPTAPDSSRIERACAAVSVDSLRGRPDTIGMPPVRKP
jgi:hypothetical protein